MKTFISAFILLFLFFCTPPLEKTDLDIHAEAKTSVTRWDHFARFLAGETLHPENPFVSSVSPGTYTNHKKYMDRVWSSLRDNTVGKMILWQKKEIPDSKKGNTVFYPLSGADFINSYSLFPNSKRYILMALEETGDPSVIDQMTKEDLRQSLNAIEKLMETYTRLSYFMSREMNKHMKNHKLSGVLPVFLIVMAKEEMHILDINSVYLDASGNAVTGKSAAGVPGIKIDFLAKGDASKRELYYFNLAISNETLSSASAAGRFIKNQTPINLMMKSAVYLFHNPKYFNARNYLLSQVNFILQDDSGIPYRDLDSSIWNIKLYGHFVRPVKLSGIVPADPVQPGLASDFKKSAMPLPFEYGYGILRGKGKSNILTAERK